MATRSEGGAGQRGRQKMGCDRDEKTPWTRMSKPRRFLPEGFGRLTPYLHASVRYVAFQRTGVFAGTLAAAVHPCRSSNVELGSGQCQSACLSPFQKPATLWAVVEASPRDEGQLHWRCPPQARNKAIPGASLAAHSSTTLSISSGGLILSQF
jgi:hypothetical protein